MMHLSRAAALAGALALAFAGCSSDPEPNPNPTPTKQKPTIKRFTADPTAVARGATAVLSYEVTNATTLSFSTDAGTFGTKGADALTGMITTPAINADTVFILTAEGEGGSTTQRVTVTIDAAAIAIVDFSASPSTVEVGGMTTLSWQTSGAKTLRLLRDGVEILSNNSDRVNMGTATETLDALGPVRFRLEVANDAGMNASREITVTAAEPVTIAAFTARPQVFSGASAMISVSWTTANATALSLTANGTAVPGFMGNVATGTVTVEVTGATTFVLTAEGLDGPKTASTNVSRAVGEAEPNDDPMTATPLMDTGAQGEITADDVDYYQLTLMAGANVTAELSDGMGGCPFDTKLTLLDDMGNEVAFNDDGRGLCSVIDPLVNPAAADLPAGTYYLRVEGYDADETGMYALVVRIGAAACGNQIIEASRMENCDDGNTATMDGCDASCHIEIRGSINMGGDMTFTGMIPENGTAAYSITMTSQGYIAADVFVPTTGVCMDADTVLILLDSNNNVLGSDDDGGIGTCSSISPSDEFAAVGPGTYTLLVATYDGSALPAYTLRLRSLGLGCGNGVIEMGETCDDGNTASGDGCTNMCVIEIAGSVMGGTADMTFSANITPGREYVYEINVTSPAYFSAITGVPTLGTCAAMDSDTILVLTSSTGAVVLSNDNFGGAPCARIDPTAASMPTQLRAGRYLLTLAAADEMAAIPAVQTRIRLFGMGCGNGVLEGVEQCDDGNTTADNNGCTTTCTFDMSIVQESEPNDTLMTADAVGNARTSTVVLTGSIGNMGADTDIYTFEVTGAAAALTARTYRRLGETNSTCSGADTVMWLTDAQGTVIARNDDRAPGVSVCSEISGTTTGTSAGSLAAGRYYLNVIDYRQDNEIPRYMLDVRLR